MKYLIYKNDKLEIVESNKKTLDYKELQNIVGGYIEYVALDPYNIYSDSRDIDIILNEEGKLIKLEPSLKWALDRDILCGPLVFCATNSEGETIGLTEIQIKVVENYVKENKLDFYEKEAYKIYLENNF